MTLQYRRAIYREFSIAALTRLIGLPLLVDVRAGQFRTWYESASRLERRLTRFLIEAAKEITVEGRPYLEFIKTEFGREATYLPNFVPSDEIPEVVPQKCLSDRLNVLFAGYCYDGKGVKELVAGCSRAASDSRSLKLTLAGTEADEFAVWMDGRAAQDGLEIVRAGLQSHDRVLELYDDHDVFCLPTRHAGEGHSNAINEAMMKGMVIVTTRHGFIPEVLNEESCYFVETNSAQSIAEALSNIDANRDQARAKAQIARSLLQQEYSSDIQIPVLETIYRRLVSRPGEDNRSEN